jgi:hypothetical protein
VTGLLICIGVFLTLIAGGWLGRFCARKYPDVAGQPETLDAIKRSIALLTTMTAMVLGLLISNGKQSFDMRSTEISSLAANIALLDQTLMHYGEEAAPIRSEFQQSSKRVIASLWKDSEATNFEYRSANEGFIDKLAMLEPRNGKEETLKAEAVRLTMTVAEERFRLATINHSMLPVPATVAIIIWLCIIFLTHGFTSPQKPVVVLTDIVVALSAAIAITIAVELDTAFGGLLQVSQQPLAVVLRSFG